MFLRHPAPIMVRGDALVLPYLNRFPEQETAYE